MILNKVSVFTSVFAFSSAESQPAVQILIKLNSISVDVIILADFPVIWKL